MPNLRYAFLAGLKIIGKWLYPSRLEWLGPEPKKWEDVSLILVLNHTSLFENVLGITLPFSFLRQLSERLIIPVADSTMQKPLGNFIFSRLAPKVITLTRRRDASWQDFLNQIDSSDICIFMPEGRMKRTNGLDKDGNPMTVRSGVYDLMQRFRGQTMVLVYSQGLHHVLAPGQRIPRIFRKIEAKAECISVDKYIKKFSKNPKPWKAMAQDLEKRRDQHCPI